MIVLQAKDLTKSYGAQLIFDQVSFVIREGEKVGLVGPNGAGKTTLFKCITGEELPDSGEVARRDKVSMGYLAQIPDYPEGTKFLDVLMEAFADLIELRVRLHQLESAMGQAPAEKLQQIMDTYASTTEEYERAGGFSCESMARRVTAGLGFSEADLTREINSFSGGEKTRAGLARLLVRAPDLLLLDEPTNHLDLEAVEWLEGYLKSFNGAVLLISHDRYFLDQVTGTTLELEQGELDSYPGNYSNFQRLKEEKVIAQARAHEKQQKKIKETEEYIERYRAGIKSKQARGRQSQLDRLERIEAPRESLTLRIGPNNTAVKSSGELVLEISDLSFGFAAPLLAGVNLQVNRGEKLGLVGRNGVGKSTLLKLITGKIESRRGSIRLGSRVSLGYYDQEYAGLDGNNRVIDELTANFAMGEGEARNHLGAFLFRGDDVFRHVRELSGGEKGRLSFLKLVLTGANFLILDEPTNHLDAASRTVIEDYLQEYSGSILAVSHDRYFLDKVISKTVELKDNLLKQYQGNYSYYKEKKEQQLKEQAELQAKPATSVSEQRRGSDKPKLNKGKTREEIACLEKEIESMEERLAQLSELLAAPASYQEEGARELVNEYKILEQRIPESYDRWERLNELLANG